MQKTATMDAKNARYRQRLREAGSREVLFQLPDEMITLIDDIKNCQHLPSRSLALLQLIERGREEALGLMEENQRQGVAVPKKSKSKVPKSGS